MKSLPTYQLITSIDNLSMAAFIDCLCDQKFQVLVIKGNPPQPEILESWGNLYSQYFDAVGDGETHYIVDLQKQAALLQYKITVTEGILEVLKTVHVCKLVETLTDFGFFTKDLVKGNPGYQKAMNKIRGKLAPMRLSLREKNKEITQYYEDQSTETISRQFFYRQMARLSKYQGYHMKAAKIMVTEYVAVLNDYLSQSNTVSNGEEG